MMRPSIELLRVEENDQHGTLGIWRIMKEWFCITLEPSDQENAINISSIPAQQYICERRPTGLSSVRRLGLTETFEVLNVPGRDGIKIHPGNTDEHTQGCILLAEKIGKLGADRAALNSGQTFLKFMNYMADHKQFHLTILEKY